MEEHCRPCSACSAPSCPDMLFALELQAAAPVAPMLTCDGAQASAQPPRPPPPAPCRPHCRHSVEAPAPAHRSRRRQVLPQALPALGGAQLLGPAAALLRGTAACCRAARACSSTVGCENTLREGNQRENALGRKEQKEQQKEKKRWPISRPGATAKSSWHGCASTRLMCAWHALARSMSQHACGALSDSSALLMRQQAGCACAEDGEAHWPRMGAPRLRPAPGS